VEHSSKIYEEMVAFVKARAAAEEAYAEGLRKVATMPLSTHDGSTMNSAVQVIYISEMMSKRKRNDCLSLLGYTCS
jgi:hypothetical protein